MANGVGGPYMAHSLRNTRFLAYKVPTFAHCPFAVPMTRWLHMSLLRPGGPYANSGEILSWMTGFGVGQAYESLQSTGLSRK